MHGLVYYYPEEHEFHFQRGHPERPERVEVIRSALEESGLWQEYPHLAPADLDNQILESVHDPSYLQLLRRVSENGQHLDGDTYTTSASWQLALNAAGGAVAVASAVWKEESRRGFALTRPPGHHATRKRGMGFCLLNNVAVAAEYLCQDMNAEHLAIVDLDLHHGNGTEDIFWEREDVFYLSTHQFPFYPGSGYVEDTGEGPGSLMTANIPLPSGAGDEAFTTIMQEVILPLLTRYNPQMLLVSVGFDTHWCDPLGGLLLSVDGYAHLIQHLANWADLHCDGRIALFLEGGYDLDASAALGLACSNALLGKNWDDPLGPSPQAESAGWKMVVRDVKNLWNIG